VSGIFEGIAGGLDRNIVVLAAELGAAGEPAQGHERQQTPEACEPFISVAHHQDSNRKGATVTETIPSPCEAAVSKGWRFTHKLPGALSGNIAYQATVRWWPLCPNRLLNRDSHACHERFSR